MTVTADIRIMAAQPLREGLLRLPISQNTPLKSPPAIITAEINWKRYGAAPNVDTLIEINVKQANTSDALDAIRSVYIDNTVSSTPVYVFFPDTSFTVFCPPLSCVMSPVWTNQNSTAQIYASQFSTTEDPITNVQFSNVCHAGYTVSPAGLSSGSGGTPITGLTISRLVVIGGGGGGGPSGATAATDNGSGGGGAGAFIDDAIPFVLSSGAYPVVVGPGGGSGANGTNSSFAARVASGGGAGASYLALAGNGGSGGGGRSLGDFGSPANSPGGTGVQGFAGGAGSPTGNGTALKFGGGGGGAGGVGAPGTAAGGGNGGAGTTTNIRGFVDDCCSGGGGAGGGSGGVGGGAGGNPAGVGGGHGVTFGSGAGGCFIGANGGTGATGGVFIRYAGPPAATGGAITAVGGDTVHYFNGNGTFTVL